jgi:outer membrane immunogenic protein
MIRRILLASAGAMALAGPAFAADLAPPPAYVPPPPMWTGFYVGVNAGYDWAASTGVNTVSLPAYSDPLGVTSGLAAAANGNLNVDNNGFIGGGQIGYNYQFANSFVAGLEADIDGVAGATAHGSVTTNVSVVGVPITTELLAQKSVNYVGTVRGRFGYLVIPTLLVYGTGGFADGGFDFTTTDFQSGTNTFLGAGYRTINYNKVGWTAGGGIEWMAFPNWSVKIEYLYYDLGSVTSTGVLSAFTPVPPVAGVYALSESKTHLNGNVVRAGINYHFNWFEPAPVVAKY